MTDWSDSTVYVPYLVAIERDDGEVRVSAAHFVTLTPDFVFVRDPAGGFANHPIRSVRSARVTVRDLPADHDLLRAEYPNAYQPWHPYIHTHLRDVHESRTTLAAKARQTGRPPAHLVAKAHEFGYDLTDKLHTMEPEPDSLKALFSRRSTRYDCLVFVKPGTPDPYQILSRHHIGPDSLYRISSWGFAATLTGLQLEKPAVVGGPALAEDPDIERVERDPDRLAPHFRVPRERRVEGEYLVNVRGGGDPLTVAARAGVSPGDVFDNINTFAAAMTNAQVQALRQDPDVVDIEDNAILKADWDAST